MFIKLPGPDREKLGQRVKDLFANHRLKVTNESGIKIRDFLDISLNLENGTYIVQLGKTPDPPYMCTRGRTTLPAHIKKGLPRMISKRISTLSSSKDIIVAIMQRGAAKRWIYRRIIIL